MHCDYFNLSPEVSVQNVNGEEQGLLHELVSEVNPGQPVHQLSSLAGSNAYLSLHESGKVVALVGPGNT